MSFKSMQKDTKKSKRNCVTKRSDGRSEKKKESVSDSYLLKLFHEIVGFRANWECEMPDCGATGHDLNPHHVEGRDNKSTRYDAEHNGIWLCYNHHCFAHNNPREFKKILIYNKVRSREWFEELTRRANIIVKFNKYFREMWKEKLMAELTRLGVRGWRK